MKKKIVAAGVCLSLSLAALCACNTGSSALTAPNDIYGMGAVSTVKLLGSEISAQAMGKLSSVTALAAKDGAESGGLNEVKLQTEKFNEYFTALDGFFGEDIVTTVSETNTDANYPYETKLTITGKEFDGETVSYTMYFTEKLSSTVTVGDETESVYSLEGIMAVGGADYYLSGERSFEQEEGETENEIKIRAYADLADKTSYVQMEQEYSVEAGETETEYLYSVYSGGKLVEQTSVEFETERKGGKEETEYELEFISGGAKGWYEVERETVNGKTRIKVNYNINGERGKFYISETTDENGKKHYEYSFDDDGKLVY